MNLGHLPLQAGIQPRLFFGCPPKGDNSPCSLGICARNRLDRWEYRLHCQFAMEIRFISTLTPEDEEHYAPSVLHAVAAILDRTGLAYTLRIETTSEKVFQHNHPAAADASLPVPTRRVEESVVHRPVPAGS